MLPPVVRENRLPHGDGLRQGLTVEKHDAPRGGVVAADRHGMPFRPVLRLLLRTRRRNASLVQLQPEDRLLAEQVGEVRSVEQTSELQSLMSHSYAIFCLKK